MSEDLTQKLPKGDDNVALILNNIDSRLQNLERKVEERLHDTRPIWQKVVADIAVLQEGQGKLQEGQQQLQEGQQQLQEGQKRLEVGVRDIKTSVREIYFKLDVLNKTMLTVQANHLDVDARVRELEAQQHKPTNSST
jgi:uncharacterized phage infection (PIP) family protein YhgE